MERNLDKEVDRPKSPRRQSRSPSPKPRSKELQIRRTPVGKGVFAGKHYRAYDLIGEICGDLIDDPQYGSNYCFNLENGLQLEPFPPFRYVNHSCDPNCHFDFVDEPSTPTAKASRRILLFCLHEIKPGVELTIDYNWEVGSTIRCRCQSPNCRGWIVGEEKVDGS